MSDGVHPDSGDAGLFDDEAVKQRLAYVADDVLQEVYLGRVIDAEISDQRLRAAYQARLASQADNQEVRARHILLDSEEDARAVIAKLGDKQDHVSCWVRDLIERRGYLRAVVALAARNARLIWTLMVKREDYRAVKI